jgi:HEXXH motif-containing protein
MTLRYHAIPRDLFDALAAGGGGPEAIGVLAAAEHSKHVILLRGVLAAAQAAGATQARCARIGWEVLAEVEHHDHDVAAWVTRYPSVGAWALETLRAPDTDDRAPQAGPARLAAVAAAAAVRSGLDAEVPVLPVAGIVSLPSLGVAQVDADSAVVRSYPGRAEVRWARGRVEIPLGGHRDAPGWLGIRNCRAGSLEAVIEDLDPFRMPTVTGLAPRLTAREARDWQRALQQGWQVLAEGYPGIAAEVAAAISVIVPLSRSVHGHLSSSSPEAFGAVAMSEPPDPDTCASTLTHEVQHLKLCGVLAIVSLTLPDDGRRYYAPWRDDPRPIAGLLQGAYAYLGVTEFWRRRRQLAVGAVQLRADGEFALWREGTRRVIGTLQSSNRLTTAGTDFVQRMSETASRWMSDPVPRQAQANALREATDHLVRWELHNGPAPRLA